jgi:hypothetical protein
MVTQMGLGLEVVAGRATNPGAAFTALTPGTGNQFAVRSADAGTPIFLDDQWAKGGTAGVFRIRSPRLHDNVSGVGFPYQINNARSFLERVPAQPLYAVDTLIPEITGGAAETDVGLYTVYYESISGLAANLATWDEISGNVKNILTNQVNVAAGATLGDWSAGTAINATEDKLHADSTYALLGWESTVGVAAIAVAGTDTANLRVGGPGALEPIETRDWFIRKSQENNRPYIPLIKANNKGTTLVFQLDNLAGAANLTFLMLAELAS